MQKHKRIYLDYAATTPTDTGVVRAMMPYFSDCFGNPSSTHWDGQRASAAVFHARQTIARALGVDYTEIIFTGSATEANNLALRGVANHALIDTAYANTRELREYNDSPHSHGLPFSSHRLRIIISAIEHESVMEPCRVLEKERGVEVVRIPVNHEGIINIQKLKDALNERTILVSVQYANSEIGIVQPIKEIGAVINHFRRTINHQSVIPYLLFHTDAAQAFQFLPCMADELGVDLLTLSAHKMYGPKGIGMLYARNAGHAASKISNPEFRMPNVLSPMITGGGQEFGMRAGTENVPVIVGFGAAIALAEKMRNKEAGRVRVLRDYFWKELKKIVPDAEINGSLKARLPHILNVYFPGRSSQDLCIELDLLGIAVSPGTACSSRAAEPSPVIKALGLSADRASSSIRFSFGRATSQDTVKAMMRVMKKRFSN